MVTKSLGCSEEGSVNRVQCCVQRRDRTGKSLCVTLEEGQTLSESGVRSGWQG